MFRQSAALKNAANIMQLPAVSKSAGTMFADNALEYLDYA
jgi:hypothetical protein